MLAAEGAVLFLEKVSPALEHVDSSSGAIGSDQQVGDQNKQQPHREPSFSPLRSFRKSAQQLGLLLELPIRHTPPRVPSRWSSLNTHRSTTTHSNRRLDL